MEIPQGHYLYRLGEEGRSVYFVERGSISPLVPLHGGGELRLRKLGPGAVVGEMDYYDGTPRDADALVTQDGVLWQLPAKTLEQLSRRSPQQAELFHIMLARVMSRRIA